MCTHDNIRQILTCLTPFENSGSTLSPDPNGSPLRGLREEAFIDIAKKNMCFPWNELFSPQVLDLDGSLSHGKPQHDQVKLSRGRVLSGQALWRLLIST